MPYELAGNWYPSKHAITERCREILHATPDGINVNADDFRFLVEVFAHHPEWAEKAAKGCDAISVARSDFYGTRYFTIMSGGELVSDISFPHAIKHIPGARNAARLPQTLIDFRNAARAAVRDQIDSFRASANPVCALTGADLSKSVKRMHVDHVPPFDRLLFDFCCGYQINPTRVSIQEVDTVPVFRDESMRATWCSYHKTNAGLRILSREANLALPKPKHDWQQTFSFSYSSINHA